MSDISSASLTVHPADTLFGTVAVKGDPFILVRMRAEDGGIAIAIETGNGVDQRGLATVLRGCADMVDTAES